MGLGSWSHGIHNQEAERRGLVSGSLRPSPLEWCHSQLVRDFPPCVISSRNSLTDTLRLVSWVSLDPVQSVMKISYHTFR